MGLGGITPAQKLNQHMAAKILPPNPFRNGGITVCLVDYLEMTRQAMLILSLTVLMICSRSPGLRR
jgi:hypothetical protein